MKLNEIKHLQKINEAFMEKINSFDELMEILTTHCSDALKTIDEPLVRGMKDVGGWVKLHGEEGGRKSQYTDNYYTLAIDAATPSNFPKRSKAVICANWENREHAEEYADDRGSEMYCLFPFNGVNVAWTGDADDIFYIGIEIAGRKDTAIRWNQKFKQMGIRDTSFSDMVADLTKYRDTGIVSGVPYQSWVDDVEDFDEELRRAYSEPFEMSTTANPTWNNVGPVECWFSGECIAIREDELEEVKDALEEME